MLEYFIDDDETKVIAMYIEGVKNGPDFFRILREATAVKPVIILKGGKGEAGTQRTLSHTASIAGSFNTWKVLFRQCNAIQADDFNDLLDLTAAFNFLPPITGKRVGVVGGGGGISVLSADECENAGLDVVDLPDDVREFIGQHEPDMKYWMGNPIDFSITTGTKLVPHDLLKSMTESPGFDFLICKVTEDLPFNIDHYEKWLESELDIYLNVNKKKKKPMIITVSNPLMGAKSFEDRRWKKLFDLRDRLIENKIAFFSHNNIAARAVSRLADYYIQKENQ